MDEIGIQRSMKSSLQSYIMRNLDLVKQSTEAYCLIVEDDIASLEAAFFQNIWKICTQAAERFDSLRRDVLGSGDSQQWQQGQDIHDFWFINCHLFRYVSLRFVRQYFNFSQWFPVSYRLMQNVLKITWKIKFLTAPNYATTWRSPF